MNNFIVNINYHETGRICIKVKKMQVYAVFLYACIKDVLSKKKYFSLNKDSSFLKHPHNITYL